MKEVEHQTAQAKLDKNEDPFKDKHPKGYQHSMIIECKDRSYQLFAKEYNFKELFIFVLNSSIQQKDKFKEDKERRYNSVQRPSTSTNEPIYLKTEENISKIAKNQSQINFYNKNSYNQNQGIEISNDDTNNNSIEIRKNVHKQNISQDIQQDNQGQKFSKKRHESVKIPQQRKHLLSENNNEDNSQTYKDKIRNDSKQQQNSNQLEINQLSSNGQRTGIDLSQPLQLKMVNKQSTNNQSEYLQREGNEIISEEQKLDDKRKSSVRRKESMNQNIQNNVIQEYQEKELIQKAKDLSQNIDNNQLQPSQTKNDIPRPRSKNNTHRQNINQQEQQFQNSAINLQQQDNDIQTNQIQNQIIIVNNDKNQQQSLCNQQQQNDELAQNNSNFQYQHESAYMQTEAQHKPSSRQKSSRPPSHQGRTSQKNSGREINNDNNFGKKDSYGNLSIPSSAAKKHRKQIQERMEIALRQLNEEQSNSQQVLSQSINMNESVAVQGNCQQDSDNQDLLEKSQIHNDDEQSILHQYPKSVTKRKVKKRALSRLSNQSNKNQQETPASVNESDQNEKSINSKYYQGQSQSQNIINEAELQKLNEIEDVSLQVKQTNSSPNIHRRLISGKKNPKKRQSDIIIIQPDSEHATEVINIRPRLSDTNDLKNQKGIKEKIQDIIDDRGSDLSGDDQTNLDDDLLSPTNNVNLDFQKANSYSSVIQLPINLQKENQNYYGKNSSEYQQQPQRLRSTSTHEKFSSPIRERNVVMMHNQLKIVSTPARQSMNKFESSYNHTGQPKVVLSSKDMTELQKQMIIPNESSQASQSLYGNSNKLINLQQIQEGTVGLLKDGSKTLQGNEKLIEMIKNNLTQLQRFSSNPIAQISSQNYQENPYERQNSQASSNQLVPQNNSSGDIFHADATTRLQLLEKWENKFGKSQLDENNQNDYDSYEWDKEGDDFQNSPSKKVKTGANTTTNVKQVGNIQINQTGAQQNYGFEQQARKISQKDLMKDLLQQPMLSSHFSQQTYKTSTNQDFQKKKQQSEQVLNENDEKQFAKKSSHKKTKSQVQNSLPSKPVMFSQTSQIPNNPYTEYGGQPINIIQNFNINQLNLLNMCNQQENNYCQTHQSCNASNNNAKFSSTFSQTNANKQNNKFQQDTQHLNILERIRMAHKVRGGNQSAQGQMNSSSSKQDLNEESTSRTETLNQIRQVNQSQLNIKSDPTEMLGQNEPTLKMPKSSKVPSQDHKLKSTYQNIQSCNFNNLLDSKQSVYDNNQVDKSDTYSVITKNSSSKSKIILKSSQIIKGNQPIQIASNKKRKSHNEVLSPSYTQEHLVLVKQSKFFNPSDIEYTSYTQDTQNLKARNSSSTPSPQKQKMASQRIQSTNFYSNLNNNSFQGIQQITQKQNELLVQSINNVNNKCEEEGPEDSMINQVQLKQQINGTQINQQKPKVLNPSDTFDYNWDDETLNHSIVQDKVGHKASLKTKLKLSSIKNKGSIVTKLQDHKDEQMLQNKQKLDSVRQVIEENAQISIWD